MTITVYSKPHCPQCDRTKHDLDMLGIDYRSIDLSRDREQRDRLVAAGHRQAPVVETEHGAWSGYDQARIRALVAA